MARFGLRVAALKGPVLCSLFDCLGRSGSHEHDGPFTVVVMEKNVCSSPRKLLRSSSGVHASDSIAHEKCNKRVFFVSKHPDKQGM